MTTLHWPLRVRRCLAGQGFRLWGTWNIARPSILKIDASGPTDGNWSGKIILFESSAIYRSSSELVMNSSSGFVVFGNKARSVDVVVVGKLNTNKLLSCTVNCWSRPSAEVEPSLMLSVFRTTIWPIDIPLWVSLTGREKTQITEFKISKVAIKMRNIIFKLILGNTSCAKCRDQLQAEIRKRSK